VWSLDDGVVPQNTMEMFSVCEVCFTAFPGSKSCPTCGSSQLTIKEFGTRLAEETDDELHEVDLTRACPECEGLAIRITRGPGPFDVRIDCSTCAHKTYVVDRPKAARASMGDKKREYLRLRQVAMRQQFKAGWADHRYHDMFTVWPASGWKRLGAQG
jgi:Zn finger protein HypA/HybF involved in hydrogenase expression